MAEDSIVLLADVVLGLHAAFVGFVVFGQVFVLCGWALGWPSARNRTFRLLHLAAIGIVVLQAWLGLRCPLTVLEASLRESAGALAQGQSFIGHWLSRLIYYDLPTWVFTSAYSLFGLLVVLSFVGCPPRRRNASRRDPQVTKPADPGSRD
jgi:hypothetical protein